MIPTRPTGPHPGAECLFRAARAPAALESKGTLDHAMLCAACSEELAAIEAFSARSPDIFGSEERRALTAWARFAGEPPPRRAALGFVPPFAMAAAVCLAVGLAFLLPRRNVDVLRGGEESAGTYVPTGDIRAAPSEFRFPQSAAGGVRVSVFDANSGYAWTSPPAAPGQPVIFPESERVKLKAGVAYGWAVLSEGSPLPSQRFRIRP